MAHTGNSGVYARFSHVLNKRDLSRLLRAPPSVAHEFKPMTRLITRFATLLSLVITASTLSAAGPYQVVPESVALSGNFDQAQLVVMSLSSDGAVTSESTDVSAEASFQSSDPSVVEVLAGGGLVARGNGQAEIQLSVEDWSETISVTVDGIEPSPSIDFAYHVQPLLSKLGCNMGACHASQHGKGGFILSVFGFEPSKDHQAITKDRLQRRVDYITPDNSLFLLKPTMQAPHGGGKRLRKGTVAYDTLVAWVASGTPAPSNEAAEVTQLEIYPNRRVAKVDDHQQLRVLATYSDGKVRDVTRLARYDSMNEGMLSVDDNGVVGVHAEGQGPIMVRFEGHAGLFIVSVPFSQRRELTDWQSKNFVDELAAKKFVELGIEPSTVCDDATFIRRAFLDAVGGMPTAEEVSGFLASTDPNKRKVLIDKLLGLTGDPAQDIYNDRYASYWTLKWSDLIRNSTDNLGEQGMWSLHNWIRESFRVNKPIDKFVQQIVTAKGSIYMNGPANYFRINGNVNQLTEATAQLFMGVRLECAKCHHHPFENYSQADYYGMAAFFARVATKNSEEFGLFGRETIVVVQDGGDVNHPKTGKKMVPTALHGPELSHPLDRRIPLASWLTSTDNDWFAKSVVNRYVRYLLGRGLVEPVDDLRSTNPATNEELFEALAEHLVANDYDLKQLISVIMNSRLYQLNSQPTAENSKAGDFYAYYRVKRLAAETLLDNIDHSAGTKTKFQSLPLGTRAIDLPDANYPNFFLKTFGKPRRTSVCECERSPDENLAQALHTLNGQVVTSKIASASGRIANLIENKTESGEIINQLYISTLARNPSDEERAVCQEIVDAAPNQKEGLEDLLWALMNSKQFLYNH